MILVREPGGTFCVRQSDHGRMATAMADAWAGPLLDPAVLAVVRDALRLHDTGWDALDDAPVLDRASGMPVAFRDVERSARLRAQAGGVIAAAQEAGPYAGLLASMHFSALYGPAPRFAAVRPGRARRVRSLLREHAAREERLRVASGRSTGDVSRDSVLMRAIDGMSIMLLARAARSLRRAVPAGDGTVGDVGMRKRPDGTFAIEPWPLRVEQLELPVPGRLLDASSRSDADLRERWAATPATTVTWVLRREE